MTNARSEKIWRVEVAGDAVTVIFGRIGSAGQNVIKTYGTPERAGREADKLIAETLGKGYVEFRA